MTDLRQYLPSYESDAINLRISEFSDWVVFYEDKYGKTRQRFVGDLLTKSLVKELGGRWAVADDEHHRDVIKHPNGLEIHLSTKGYGVRPNERIQIFGAARIGNQSRTTDAITVAASKTVAKIAKDINNKILPKLSEVHFDLTEKVKAENQRQDDVANKMDELEREYPGIDFSLDAKGESIRVSTSYDANISVTGYIYYSNFDKAWRLSTNGIGFNVTDIDSESGRAILRAIANQ